MMILVKDQYNVSGRAYHEMARICKEMPRHYRIKERIGELNKLWNIRPTPHGTLGVQQTLQDRLKVRIAKLLEVLPDSAPLKMYKRISVKLSGDGTCIGKRLNVINFTFTILDEGSAAYSAEGNHPLVISKDAESYESLANSLADIRSEVESLKCIQIGEQDYEILYYLGGDWKFLALVTGIDSATSRYACIWCKCPMDQRGNIDKKWSITDPKLGARTIEENLEISTQPASCRKFNVSRAPLFPTIPLHNVVIDNLHLFLRVADVLINHLIEELHRQDAIDKSKRFTTFTLCKYKHLEGYQKFCDGLRIPNYKFWIGKTSKQLKWRTLTGPEKLKLFDHIDIPHLLPTVDSSTTSTMQKLWKELIEINRLLYKRPDDITDQDIDEFQGLAHQWVVKYLTLYHTKEVTPYIHAMLCHVGEFLRIHGGLLPFTQQGLEKYNDVMTKDYFRGSNHQGEQALLQIMQKHNRMEHLKDLEVKTPKHHEVTCSNCGVEGHNKLSCISPCTACYHAPFRTHLVNTGGKLVSSCQQENIHA